MVRDALPEVSNGLIAYLDAWKESRAIRESR
jgi:hypothetical protein